MCSQDPRGRIKDLVQWRRSVCIVLVSEPVRINLPFLSVVNVMSSLQQHCSLIPVPGFLKLLLPSLFIA